MSVCNIIEDLYAFHRGFERYVLNFPDSEPLFDSGSKEPEEARIPREPLRDTISMVVNELYRMSNAVRFDPGIPCLTEDDKELLDVAGDMLRWLAEHPTTVVEIFEYITDDPMPAQLWHRLTRYLFWDTIVQCEQLVDVLPDCISLDLLGNVRNAARTAKRLIGREKPLPDELLQTLTEASNVLEMLLSSDSLRMVDLDQFTLSHCFVGPDDEEEFHMPAEQRHSHRRGSLNVEQGEFLTFAWRETELVGEDQTEAPATGLEQFEALRANMRLDGILFREACSLLSQFG